MVRIGLYSEDRSFKPLLSSALGRDYQVLLETDEEGINRLIDARGCDVRSSGFAIDVAFALDGLGFSLASGDPLGVDIARHFHQSLGYSAWVSLTPNSPVFGRQGDEHALVAALDSQSEMKQRHRWGRL